MYSGFVLTESLLGGFRKKAENKSVKKCRHLMFAVVWAAFAACGPAGFDGGVAAAVRKQRGLDSGEQSIWARNPAADAGDPSLTIATANFDAIPRTKTVLPDVLDQNAPLEGTNLRVLESTGYQFAPSFYDWAGEIVPWADPAFHVYNVFYHAQKARSYANDVLSEISSLASGVALQNPLTIYALEEGGLGDSGFSLSTSGGTTTAAIHLTKADLVSGKPPYKAADDADTIYHELAHFIQYEVSPNTYSATSSNYLVNVLNEGLADFSAAAVLGDESTNDYFMKHVKLAGSLLVPNMNQSTYTRSVANAVYFPQAFSGALPPCYESHTSSSTTTCGFDARQSDGRALAGALNDFRRYLVGYVIYARDGTKIGGPIATKLAADVAWKNVYHLAYKAYVGFDGQSTLHGYGLYLISSCAALDWCSAVDIKNMLSAILVARGIVSAASITSAPATIATTPSASTNSLYVNVPDLPGPSPSPTPSVSTVGFRPLSEGQYFANTDGFVDPCEGLLIWPQIEVRATPTAPATVPARIYSVSAEIASISGFQNLLRSDGSAYESVVPVQTGNYKVMGWIEPGESTAGDSGLVINPLSRWYQQSGGRAFALYPTANDFAGLASPRLSTLAWAVRAPKSRSELGSVTWRLTFRYYNVEQAPVAPVTVTATQWLVVSPAGTRGTTGQPALYDFCPQQ